MSFKQVTLAATLLLSLANAKVIPIIYEDFELCVSPENRSTMTDFSNLEVIAETDTKVSLNGTWTFVKDTNGPWKVHVFGEIFDRNEWHMYVFNKKFDDFCKEMHHSWEPWYTVTSVFVPKTCPFKAGVSFKGLL